MCFRLIERHDAFNSLPMNDFASVSNPVLPLTLNILIYYRNKHASNINISERFFFLILYQLIYTYILVLIFKRSENKIRIWVNMRKRVSIVVEQKKRKVEVKVSLNIICCQKNRIQQKRNSVT